MDHTVDLLMSEVVTRDVKRFVTTRPEGFDHEPGQGIEMALDRQGWRDEGRPFTPTDPPGSKVLEFTIKRYPDHDGVTDRLHELAPGDRLHLSESFGTITYRGPGTFIAGGAGITPFLAILRQLAADDRLDDQTLLFSNKTRLDVICEQELRHYFGDRAVLTLTRDEAPGFESGRLDKVFLQEHVDDFDQEFYLCGPPDFVEDLQGALRSLGADPERVVLEE